MQISQNQKIMIIVVMLLGTAFIIYKNFFSNNTGASLSNIVQASSTDETLAQEILTLSDKLNNASIDPTIFASPIFASLKDFHVPTVPEPQGRLNPFQTIGVDSGTQTVSNSGNR